jgi:hypothetical protein
MKFRIAAICAALLLTAACEAPTSSSTFAERSETVTLTGTVEMVDVANRLFRVRDGRTAVTFKAGPQVKNLAQLSVGDTIELDYFESVAVGMASPDDPGNAIGEVLVGSNPVGDLPGGGAVGSVTGVVEFVSYDAGTNLATLKLQDGTTEVVAVQPEMRQFAQARQPGDRIIIAIDRAVAVSVQPAG